MASGKPTAPKIRQAADRLFEAARTGVPCMPVRDLIGERDVAAAYAIQEINTKRWIKSGRRLVGRKIGLTSRAVQAQLGVDQPDYGMLYADMNVPEGMDIAAGRVMQPKVEAEIAFVLGRDLDGERLTVADIIGAVAYALPAIEIVGSRIDKWNIKLTDTVADNASSGLFVLGSRPCRLADFDHRLCGMAMERRGDVVSVGAGAACLGNPIASALWLAQVMAGVGRPLQAGDIVMSGALGPMVAAEPGDVFDVKINGLGAVQAAFAPAA